MENYLSILRGMLINSDTFTQWRAIIFLNEDGLYEQIYSDCQDIILNENKIHKSI
jgi:hypothetical protein